MICAKFTVIAHYLKPAQKFPDFRLPPGAMTSASSNIPPGFEAVQVSGPLIIGYLGEWALFGIVTVQLYLYYQAFPNDRWFTKCLVYTVYALQLTETVVAGVDAFNIFGYGFGNLNTLTKVNVVGFISPIITAIVSLIVQSFYAYRLYKFSESRILPLIIVAASLSVSICAFVTERFGLEAGSLTTLDTARIAITGGIWLGGSALIDVTIAVSMIYYASLFSLAKKDTGFRQTHALVSKLIRLTIETGSSTALVAILVIVVFFAAPGKGYYVTPITYMSGLYSNTMLAVLNSRLQIVGGRSVQSDAGDLITFTTYLGAHGTNAGTTTHSRSAPIVAIQTEVYSGREEEPLEMKRMNDFGDV
ncbi:hypothetical protein B0H11DRAFT_2297835 [Mycena galericulata]|nr:hypothetical protein B0H11DRAFT_2297835 [Mycena galericulata]